MKPEAKIDLKNIEGRISAMKTIDKYLIQAGESIVVMDLLDNWNSGQGGDGKVFRKGQPKYLEWKASKGRKKMIDMFFSGDLQKSVYTKKKDKNSAIVTVRVSEEEKASKLSKSRENIFWVNDNMIQKVRDFIYQKITGGK